jgi:ribosomal protein L6P/L9E
MSHSLTIDKIISIENINHPHDFQVNFEGGSVTYNATNGPLRFWYENDLVCIESEADMKLFKNVFDEKKFRQNVGSTWEFINLGRYKDFTKIVNNPFYLNELNNDS